MLLNAYLIGLALSLAVLMIQDYADGRRSAKDFAACLTAAASWFLIFPLCLWASTIGKNTRFGRWIIGCTKEVS